MIKKITVVLIIFTLLFSIVAYALPEGVPEKLEAPQLIKLELKTNDEGRPYFYMEYKIPQSVIDLDKTRPTDGWANWEDSRKVDNGEWEDFGGGHLDTLMERPVEGKPGVYSFESEPIDEGDMENVDIKSRAYAYKSRLSYTYYYGTGNGEWDDVVSPYSNELSIGTTSFYQGASSWAVPVLDKASEYGFITDRIKSNIGGNITREEFAEIAVKLYEKYTGIGAEAGAVSFVDTTNPEILKAANLGLVTGVGNNKYDPNALVTRQQMATILLRALKVLNPTADFSTAGVPKFADDNKLKAWARDGVYYCAKEKIVTGVGENLYNPDGNASREVAVIVCTRAYELYSK